jgi:hypothetical protein
MEPLQVMFVQTCVLIFVTSVLGWMLGTMIGKRTHLLWFPALLLKQVRRLIVWISRETSNGFYNIRRNLLRDRCTGPARWLNIIVGNTFGAIGLFCAIPVGVLGSSRRRR